MLIIQQSLHKDGNKTVLQFSNREKQNSSFSNKEIIFTSFLTDRNKTINYFPKKKIKTIHRSTSEKQIIHQSCTRENQLTSFLYSSWILRYSGESSILASKTESNKHFK